MLKIGGKKHSESPNLKSSLCSPFFQKKGECQCERRQVQKDKANLDSACSVEDSRDLKDLVSSILYRSTTVFWVGSVLI